MLVDRDDRAIGEAPRAEIRARNLLHRGVAILVHDPAGRIYVHRRTETKDLFPGAYDMVVGGMVQAGESYQETARRELEEELGIAREPRFRFMHRYRDERNDAWMAVFDVTWDGPVVHQPEEVSWGAWMEETDLIARFAEWTFAPDHLTVFERYLKERGAA